MEKEQSELLDIYEIPREIFILEPPLTLITHPIGEVINQCTQPYYNHKRGCPNFGKKEGCPPRSKHITEIYNISSLHMLVMRFSFGQYIKKKRINHPEWSNRALANQRHWQAHLRSQLVNQWEIQEKYLYPNFELEMDPEAHGVNVVATLGSYGIQLDWCVEGENHDLVSFPEYMYHVFLFGQKI